ncbi:MAG: hypothetical protein U0P81_14845 [Holophagaceae bacterium]
MKWALNLVFTTAGGWLGWWLGAFVGITTAVVLSMLGTGFGLWVAIRVWRDHFEA